MRSNKLFPIHTDPACLLKWGFSSIYLNTGQSNSCHRCRPSDIPLDNFDSFHNLPDKVRARELMLQGQWPRAGCQYCQKMEDSGGISDRLLQLEKVEDPGLVSPELWNDSQVTIVTPTMLEVYFGNTCNMKCMYCRPDQSSQWEQELRKYGPMKTRSFNVPAVTNKNDYNKRLKDFWAWMEGNSHWLKRFHVLGGEPFLLEETDQCLDFWLQHPNPDMIFAMFTNGNIDLLRFEKIIEKMQMLVATKSVWKFQITASIDCWAPQAQYVRYGLDWDLFQKNFQRLVDLPWLDLSVNSAVTALTIKSMPQLLTYLDQCDQTRIAKGLNPIERSFNLGGLSGSPVSHDHPVNLGRGIFEQDFQNIIDVLAQSQISRTLEIAHVETMKKQVSNGRYNATAVLSLQQHLDELDQRRGTDWRSVFPWLENLPV
jgi:hypothetical protein